MALRLVHLTPMITRARRRCAVCGKRMRTPAHRAHAQRHSVQGCRNRKCVAFQWLRYHNKLCSLFSFSATPALSLSSALARHSNTAMLGRVYFYQSRNTKTFLSLNCVFFRLRPTDRPTAQSLSNSRFKPSRGDAIFEPEKLLKSAIQTNARANLERACHGLSAWPPGLHSNTTAADVGVARSGVRFRK